MESLRVTLEVCYKMLIIGFILIAVIYYIFKNIPKLLHKREVHRHLNKIPGPPAKNFLGNITQFHIPQDEIFEMRSRLAQEYYPIYHIWALGLAAANILTPEDCELVLSNSKHNTKSIAYDLLMGWLGGGLLISNGDKWYTRRRILTPAFHFNILCQFVEIFNEKSESLIGDLQKHPNKSFVEIDSLISDMTLKSITETSLGTKLDFNSNEHQEYKQAIIDMGKVFVYKFFRPWLVVTFLNLLLAPFMFLKELRVLRILHNFTTNIIKKRQENYVNCDNILEDETLLKKKRLAMLDLLLTIKEKDGSIDNDGIREEVDTFTFEGHDTTASALCFTLMLIACHPDVQEKILEEMREVLGDTKQKPTMEQLQDLKYMERCIKESLRMYPPVHLISRYLGEDLQLHSGYKLLKDSMVHVHIFDLHHSPQIWPDPEKYDPDRFLPENIQQRHPFAFLPFSAGGRNCIGQRFAMLETKSALCAILKSFKLEPIDTPSTIVLMPHLILKTKDKIKIKFIQRQA